MVHRREASKPNAIWQVDHAQLGIKLVREDGSTARPWLTAVIDDYSRAIAGYYLGFELLLPPQAVKEKVQKGERLLPRNRRAGAGSQTG